LKRLFDDLELHIPVTEGAIIIVPLFSGCMSCEHQVLSYYKANTELRRISYVFSMNHSKKKEFEAFINKEFNGEIPLNFITDFEDLALKLDLTFTQPKIYYLSKEEIIRVTELTAINIDKEFKYLSNFLNK